MKTRFIFMLLAGGILSGTASPARAENPPQFLLTWGAYGQGTGQFDDSRGVAFDAVRGVVYVAETWNGRVQKFSENGQYLAQYSCSSPLGVAVDAAGNFYIMDSGANMVRKYSVTGSFLTQWGSTGTGNGQFSSPNGIAVDGLGNVYVADTWNYRIQKFSSTGTFLLKWGTRGSADDQFNFPRGVAADAVGNVYVLDTAGNRVQKFTSNGTFITKWGTTGSGNGQLRSPYGIAVDLNGNVYVADTSNNRIQKFSPTGAFLTKWGSGGAGNGQFNLLKGVAAGNDKVFAADTENFRVQKFSSATQQIGIADGWEHLPARLSPGAPNPFRSSTVMEYELKDLGTVSLRVFDLEGRVVATLLEPTTLDAGRYTVSWNGRDAAGQRVVPGAYFIRLDTNRFGQTQKVILLP